MKDHIILVAFGTNSRAKNTYNQLHEAIQPQFPHSRIHWVYSSPTVRRHQEQQNGEHVRSLPELLAELASRKCRSIVVQSLHILPATEFHAIARQALHLGSPVSVGLPLLTTPDDYRRVADCLQPLINAYKPEATLILGHGTSHPSWTAYPALEQELRRRFGSNIHVAALERFPDNGDQIMEELRHAGHSEVLAIPFLLIAGMHFQRDIDGDGPASWKNRLAARQINLVLHKDGLATLPGIAEIFCDHIRTAGG